MNDYTVKVVNGIEFRIYEAGSVVRVWNTAIDEIVEASFPSAYYRSPKQAVGRWIGIWLAY